MATLKRNHVPVPWGAQVDPVVWARSPRGKPRKRRSNRPPLAHDPEDWDESRDSFSAQRVLFDGEGGDCGVQTQVEEDARSPGLVLLGGARTALSVSLLDMATHEVSNRRSKARSGLGDFEVIRIPKVVPMSEEEPEFGYGWIEQWEKLDALGVHFKRSYSDVVQGVLDGKDPPNEPGSSLSVPGGVQDDLWECL